MERTITNLKDNGILLQMSWLPISKTADIQYSELPVRWIGDSWRRQVDDVRFTSARNVRTRNFFFFARFTLQTSSVVADWCDELTQQILGQSFLSMESSVAKLNEQSCRKLELQVVHTLVQTPARMFKQRGIGCVSIKKERKKLSSEIKVSQTCESAGFMRKVSIGQYFRTIHDVDDGFGGTTASYREYTLARDHQGSEPIGWITKHTRISPVLHVKIVCCVDQCKCRIETHVPSTKRDGPDSWMATSRGPKRYVDESWHDQDDSPENGETVSSTSVERPHATTSSIEETHASKPQAQSSLMNYPCEEFIQIDKRKWNDVPAYGIVGHDVGSC